MLLAIVVVLLITLGGLALLWFLSKLRAGIDTSLAELALVSRALVSPWSSAVRECLRHLQQYGLSAEANLSAYQSLTLSQQQAGS
jgi:hypothetical protein